MKQLKSRKALVPIMLLGVLAFTLIYLLWSAASDVFLPANPATNRTVSVTVAPGESTTQLANQLQQKGLIKSALAFRVWARLKGLDRQLQPGVYSKLSPGMSVTQIIDVLQTAHPDAVEVTIIDGWRLEQIAQKLSEAGLPMFKEADFLRYTKNPTQFPDASKFPILQSIPAGQSMEGLLFPDTYDISVNATAVDVIDKLLQATTDVVNTHNLANLAQQHQMTLYQVFILASLAEREVRFNQDLPGVASVYWNRIYRPNAETVGLLDSDPSVQYARDTDNPPATYWAPLDDSGANIDPDSPWNTYTHTGWPPTPICSPSLASLLAAANPPQTDYYFFLAKKDGHNVYEATFAQFQADEQRYLQ